MIYWQLFISFFKIGLFSFGGGLAMIPLIQQTVTISHNWITETEFIDMIAISEMTPGPIAVNTATLVGNNQGGILGGMIATFGVILPSFIIISLLYFIVKKASSNPHFKSFFDGLRVVVIGLIGAGFLSVAKNAIVDIKAVLIAIITFYIVTFRKWHPILAIVLSAGLGLIFYWG